MPLDVTLTEEERDIWIERMAGEVVRRRLETPAVLLLEAHRPLSFLGSQALIVATPFLGALVGAQNVLKLSRVLEDGRNVERLILRIEALASRDEPDSAGNSSIEPNGRDSTAPIIAHPPAARVPAIPRGQEDAT